MPVRIADESGSSTQGTIAAGIRWASEHGARVINLSWGLAVGGRRPGRSSARSQGAVDRGATVTLAVMNDGSRDPNLNPWASRSPDAVRVGAVDDDGRLLAVIEPRRLGRHRRARIGDLERGAARRRCGGGRPRRAPGADRAAGAGRAPPRLRARAARSTSAGTACSTWTAR